MLSKFLGSLDDNCIVNQEEFEEKNNVLFASLSFFVLSEIINKTFIYTFLNLKNINMFGIINYF